MKRTPPSRSLLEISLLAAAAIAWPACGPETEAAPGATTEPPATTTEPTATDPPQPGAGFPCDVHAMLQRHCATCHVDALYTGPNFDSRDDLLRPARELFLVNAELRAPGTFGEHVATALREGTMPPYGAPRPAPADRNLVIAWVESGMAPGDCGALTRSP